ncbi:MAG: peptidoglycan-binding protein [bacterium]|nr:peptidoglycan-binding protein [bacterium]
MAHKKQNNLFDTNFKYILVLTILAWMTYTMPSIRSAFESAEAFDAANNIAAVTTAVAQTQPNAVVVGKPTLALKYDANKKESELVGNFRVSVDGGINGVYVSEYPGIGLKLNGQYIGVNSITVVPMVPASNVGKVTDTYGRTFYFVGPNKKVLFQSVARVSPSQMFAGSYTMSLVSLVLENKLNDEAPYKIEVPSNSTNAQVIIGEVSPYISSVTSPIKVGEKMTVTGQRMNGAGIFINSESLANVMIVGTIDGTSLSFTLPQLPAGNYSLYVKNDVTGQSNTIRFEVTGDVSGCYTFTLNLSLGSTGQDVAALQSYLIAHGYMIATSTTGYFGAETEAAVMRLQTALNMPATGFVGPITRAHLNMCNPIVVVTCPVGYICEPVPPTTPQVENCPVGYTCTVPTVVTCPAGYVCTSIEQ